MKIIFVVQWRDGRVFHKAFQHQDFFAFLASHYESLIVINISNKLSGAYRLSREVAETMGDHPINVIDSRQLSVSQGLLVHRIALAIEEGKSASEISALTDEWIQKTRLLVDIQTLEYMVRGGRVSPLKR